jgi:hypothetical protein
VIPFGYTVELPWLLALPWSSENLFSSLDVPFSPRLIMWHTFESPGLHLISSMGYIQVFSCLMAIYTAYSLGCIEEQV